MIMPYVTEQTLTDVVRERWSDIPDPRLKQVMTALVKHAHAFVREIEPTQAEWATAIDSLTRTDKCATTKRQEFILMSDVLGISMLVDAINHRQANGATPSTVEGPFHVPDAPAVANGGNMAVNAPGIACFVTGTVHGVKGEPVAGAVLDLWQTDGDGFYEARRPEIKGPWMRGLYRRSRRLKSHPHRGADSLHDPDGRHDRRTDESHQPEPHAAGAHSLRPRRAGLSRPGDASVPVRRQVDRDDAVYGVKEPLIVDFQKDAGWQQGTERRVVERAVLRRALRLCAG